MKRPRNRVVRTACGTLWLLIALSSSFGQGAVQSSKADGSSLVPGKFVDVTQKVGIHFAHQSPSTSKKYLLETMGSGVALFDYDNDGRLDIFFANGGRIDDPMQKGAIPQKDGPKYWNRLYHQKPDGTFEDVTAEAGVSGVGYSTGVAVGDYDNDGYDDLFVAGYGRSTLYHNNGNGTFTDVTASAGVGGSGWATSAAWVDYDNDGRLDLVVARYMEWDFDDINCGQRKEGYRSYCHPDIFKPASLLLYHNDGNGKFTEVSQKAGVDKPGKELGVAIADYDHDGWPDILVANDSMPEFLFHNKGNGTFEEVAMASGVALDSSGATFAGMGVDFEDYNNDGWPDVFITDLANQRYGLYTNAGDGTFDYSTNVSGLGAMTLLHSGWGAKFLDYDNDGWNDILQLNGSMLDNVALYHAEVAYKEPLLMFRNSGKGQFEKASESLGPDFMRPIAGRGLATADYDNDGDIDIVTNNRGDYPSLLRNDGGNANHWLTIQLIGTKSNRDGVGASLKLISEGFAHVEQAKGGTSYMSASDGRIHFGLGKRTKIDSLEITWPSGHVDRLTNVSIDQIIAVKEGEGIIPRQFPRIPGPK